MPDLGPRILNRIMEAHPEKACRAGRAGPGPPSDAPDPLQNVRWWILGGFVLVLAGGGYYVIQRNKNAPAMAATAGGGSMPVPRSPVPMRCQ